MDNQNPTNPNVQTQQPVNNNPTDKPSTKKWIMLIIFPPVSLVFTAILQVIVRLTIVNNEGISTSNSPVVAIVNVISIILGMAATIGIFLEPVWIIQLDKAKNAKNPHQI